MSNLPLHTKGREGTEAGAEPRVQLEALPGAWGGGPWTWPRHIRELGLLRYADWWTTLVLRPNRPGSTVPNFVPGPSLLWPCLDNQQKPFWLFGGRPRPTHPTPAPTDPQSSLSSPPPRSLGTRHSEAREKALDRAPDGGATLEQGSAPGRLDEVRGGPGNHLLLWSWFYPDVEAAAGFLRPVWLPAPFSCYKEACLLETAGNWEMGEKKPKQRGKPTGAADLLWPSPPSRVPAWTVEPAGRGTDLPPWGAGPRPQSLEKHGARQEVGPSEAGGCKMTLGPERKTSGCSGGCGEPNGGGPRLPSHSTFVQTRQSSPLAGHGPSPAPMAGGQRESLDWAGSSRPTPSVHVFVQDATYATVHGGPDPRQHGWLLSSRP